MHDVSEEAALTVSQQITLPKLLLMQVCILRQLT